MCIFRRGNSERKALPCARENIFAAAEYARGPSTSMKTLIMCYKYRLEEFLKASVMCKAVRVDGNLTGIKNRNFGRVGADRPLQLELQLAATGSSFSTVQPLIRGKNFIRSDA